MRFIVLTLITLAIYGLTVYIQSTPETPGQVAFKICDIPLPLCGPTSEVSSHRQS